MFQFLRSLFQRFEPFTVHDEYLGAMTNDRYGNWHGKLRLEALNSEIEIVLRTGDTPPNTDQVQFVRDVESRFAEIWHQTGETVFRDLDDFADGTTMDELFDSLNVVGLSFWQLEAHPFTWEVSCETPLADHLFGFMMADFENNGFRMDG